jgi:hypothetical protein
MVFGVILLARIRWWNILSTGRRNSSHTGATPFGYTELGQELGHTGDTQMAEAVLEGTFDHDALSDDASAAIEKQLCKHPVVRQIIQPIVTEEDFKSAFKCVP